MRTFLALTSLIAIFNMSYASSTEKKSSSENIGLSLFDLTSTAQSKYSYCSGAFTKLKTFKTPYISFLNTPKLVKSEKKYLPFLKVNHPENPVGMFSVFCFIAGVLQEYESKEWAGIDVDFAELGLYYDKTHGSNWWNYYCEPIHAERTTRNLTFKGFNGDEYCHYAFYAELQLSRHQIHGLIKKYIKVKAHITNKVDNFVKTNYNESFMIGVHYRGTDKSCEAPRLAYESVTSEVDKYIEQKDLKNFKIFVASDEQAFIDFMMNAYPGKIVVNEAIRSTNNEPVHLAKGIDSYLMGEQALIDCLLLSKVNVLFRTSSNLSLWSTYFSPDMPTIDLTIRNFLMR